MSAPSGKLSPEGNRTSGPPEAMAIEDADADKAASDIPIETDLQSPSERSRSDKREVNALMPRGAALYPTMTQHGFLTAGTTFTHPGRACQRAQIYAREPN